MKRFKGLRCRILALAERAKDMPEYFILTYADVELEDRNADPLCISSSEELVKTKGPLFYAKRQYVIGLN